MKKRDIAKKMTIPVKTMVKEHEELVKDLRSGSKSRLRAEAKKQGKELKEYKEKL